MKRLITLILVSLAIPPIYAGGAVDTPFLNSGPYVGLGLLSYSAPRGGLGNLHFQSHPLKLLSFPFQGRIG